MLGFMAGQHFSDKGGASNYICLTDQPEWGNYSTSPNKTEKRNKISGTEFEKEGNDTFPLANDNVKTLDSQNAPCAVCRARSRGSAMMYPGKLTCPQGWTAEYQGFLMSEFTSDHRTEYVCVDEAPEGVANGQANEDGAGLFLIESRCGTLPCPPYDPNGKEITCVVCTK